MDGELTPALDRELIADCVHCGFCLPTCPTYGLWHEEMDSPRGRIHLMDALADGSLELTDAVAEHFDRCLGCMACVTACPSGVRYDRLIEQTRALVEREHRRPLAQRLLRAAIFGVLPHRRRLRVALALRALPAPPPLRALKRLAPPWSSSAWPPVHLPGGGPRVALLAGCVQSVVFGDVNAATARVLAADDFDVHVPRAQQCCGALHAHAGRPQEGVARTRALAGALSGYDHIVTNAAGCGSHLKDHGIENAVDISELITAPRAQRRPLELSVAFQDSCHLRHAQGLVSEPRAMLAQVPGLRVLEAAEPDICCGSAGIYNIVQPQAATELGDRKAQRVLETGADAYVSANPGCLVQVSAALRRAGRPLPAFHPIELLDASIRGVDPAQLLKEARR
ncbi:MAG TPA: heterodisulfide reductase-related iron-sulfur binding cluster [Solirubrobacteraceae bacterium]|nr:heterodisulfide reductase-related iron-sulfur binding cluster [Solirubrobacteraceae bacterium]